MTESIVRYNAEDKKVLPRATAKEKDGIVMYWLDELQEGGLHINGIARLLECDSKSVAQYMSAVVGLAAIEAEIVTEKGVRAVVLTLGEELQKLLRHIARSRANIALRDRADDIRDRLAASGFKLAVMLELAPDRLAEQAVEHSNRIYELKLRKEVLALEDKTLSLRHYVATALPKAVADRILGVTEIRETVIKEVVVNERGEVLGHKPGESYNKKELCERYGLITKSGRPDYKQINAYLDGLKLPSDAWEDRQTVSHNPQLKVKYLPQLDELLGRSDRQQWIGENN